MAKSKLFERGFSKIFPPDTPIKLDAEQKAAVETDRKRVLVVAGAGSGKTRVLTERVKYLLNNGVSPSDIVAITFTNLAAEEMKERLKDVYGIGDCFIGTIHSLAHKVLELSGENFTIYNDIIDLEFHKELIEKYGKFLNLEKYLKYRDLKWAASRGEIKESEAVRFLNPSESAELYYMERTETDVFGDLDDICDYPETIQTLCKERGIISFDELLQKATKYFVSLTATYPKYVFVDEFQDIGYAEYNFLTSLNAWNYFYVGDDYQAIYGFKGGNVKLFQSLYHSKKWTKYELNHNYRNPQSIVHLGDVIMSQVSGSIPHHILALCPKECNIDVLSRKTGIPFLVQSIKSKEDYRNTFVLTRSNKELFELKNVLITNGIPCSTFKREGMNLSDIRYVMSLNTVKLITVHTSKGLEADNVHLWGNFPITVPSYLLNEEERRVMYVGVTRAKKSLTIYN